MSASTQPRTVRLRGHTIRVADDKPTFWDRAESGRWEPETLEVLAGLVGPGVAFLDIGAWVGPTALFAAACGADVVAVEADPRALDLLRANIAANPGLADRISVLAGAAAASEGTVTLASPRKPGDSMTSVLVTGSPHSVEVPALMPGQILAALPDARSRLVVKVDIEGGEYGFLPALAAALPQDTQAVLAAFHPSLLAGAGRDPGEVAQATQACFESLARFEPMLVGDARETAGPALECAAKANVTVLFNR